MNSPQETKVCVIGLGSMGFGMAESLLRDGFAVTGVDVNSDAMERFEALGGAVAADPAAGARDAELVIAVVVNSGQTEEVLFGATGAVAAMSEGGVVMSCATMSPDLARAFAARCAELGVEYLDTPISGGALRAASGELTIMGSGPSSVFARIRPALNSIAATVYELGEEAGTGAAFKVVNQLLAGVHIAAACEAITFAKAMDLDLEKVYEVITASAGNSWMFENRVPHVLEGDYSPRSAVDIFTKDLGIVTDIGRSMKFPTPIAGMALQLFVMTAAAGMGRDDDASVARMLANIAGLDLPKAASPASEG
ncbi:3-hydroxyisobutyrate dehydrogenase [Thioclava marina]|uniref:L-threonate dehydrogenase n=1 Tax=Thioclava marina TaxID=1915077 RepID=A0ABX3MSG5_9RHOB|nr:L-threonate dehydrogenase [Thioclava marina]MBD3738888.1 NAD(P)-dependent oxidoreductase [Stutzerimonas balearica]OOY14108.1 3-hydroxyisobutyrate dehydrogenase [Thioclava marina]